MSAAESESVLKPFSRLSEPGAMPGIVVAAPDEPQPEIHVIAYSNGDLFDAPVESVESLKDIVDRHSKPKSKRSKLSP